MDDLIRQTACVLRAMWKHRWLGLTVAWLTGIIGAVAIMLVPNKFEASARIYVDTQSILKPLMSGLAVQPNVEQQIVMLSRTLISRPNVEKLIRMADLDHDNAPKEAREALVDRLVKSIEIKSSMQMLPRDNLYTIVYRDQDPEKAIRVVQAMVSIFVESSQGDSRRDTDSARKFIDEQIRLYEQKLETAENRLKEFKMRHLDMQAEGGKSIANRLADLGEELNKARLDLRAAENSRDALKRQILGGDSTPGVDSVVAGSIVVPEIDGRIELQQRNLDNLLQRYTEEHPDVLATRRLIKELEEQRREEVGARRKMGITNPGAISNNPVYQQLKIAQAAAEANVASLRTRMEDYESRLHQMRDLMKIAPQVEAESSQLNRDYDINKKNYEALVARRESANISGDLDSIAGLADFRLIDPPRVTPQPVAPNRMLLLSLALFASLGFGIFTSFAASKLHPVFFDSRMLRIQTGLPLLGTVSMLDLDSSIRAESVELKHFGAAFAGLLAAYAAGSAVLWVMSRTVG